MSCAGRCCVIDGACLSDGTACLVTAHSTCLSCSAQPKRGLLGAKALSHASLETTDLMEHNYDLTCLVRKGRVKALLARRRLGFGISLTALYIS